MSGNLLRKRHKPLSEEDLRRFRAGVAGSADFAASISGFRSDWSAFTSSDFFGVGFSCPWPSVASDFSSATIRSSVLFKIDSVGNSGKSR